MKEDRVTYINQETGEEITKTKLELEIQVAKEIIKNLLSGDKNVVVGLVVYTGQVYTRVALTDDINTLNDALDKPIDFTYEWYTNIRGALNKAYSFYANNDINNSNRYLFILSDGLPTSDEPVTKIKRNGTTSYDDDVYSGKLYATSNITDQNEKEKIIKKNEEIKQKIYENTEKKIRNLEDDGIIIYSVISTFGLNDTEKNILRYMYQDNKREGYNRYKEVNNIEDMAFKGVADDILVEFEQYVKNSVNIIDTGYTIDNWDKPDTVIQNYKFQGNEDYAKFKYENTYFLEALSMDINSSNLDKFKEYAKKFYNATKQEIIVNRTDEFFNEEVPNSFPGDVEIEDIQNGKRVTTYRTLYIRDDETGDIIETRRIKINTIDHVQKYQNITIDSFVKRLESFTITPRIAITSLEVRATNGAVMDVKDDIVNSIEDRDKYIISTIPEENNIYGSQVIIDVTVNIKNDSIIQNNIKELLLNIYLPDKFKVVDGSEYIYGITDNNGINSVNKNLRVALYEGKSVLNELKNDGLIDKIEKGEIEKYINNKKHSVVLAQIIPDDLSEFQVLTNGEIEVKFKAYKHLSDRDDDMDFKVDTEIMSLTNDAYRPNQFQIYSAQLGTQRMGAFVIPTLGNFIQEQDYANSNDAVVLIPTGKDKSLKKIYTLIIILVLIDLIIF